MTELEINFFKVIESGTLEEIQSYLSILSDTNFTNNYNECPLHTAVSRGDIKIVELLLQQKNVNLHISGYLIGTPLTWAIYKGCEEIAKLLLNKEITFINALHPGAINLAILENMKIIPLFKEKGADFNLKGTEGFQQPPTWMLKPAPEPMSYPFNYDIFSYLTHTPLGLAIVSANQTKDLSLVEYLLTQCNANPNLISNKKSPLQIAAEFNNLSLVKLLLSNEAFPQLPPPTEYPPNTPHFLKHRPPEISAEIQQLIINYAMIKTSSKQAKEECLIQQKL